MRRLISTPFADISQLASSLRPNYRSTKAEQCEGWFEGAQANLALHGRFGQPFSLAQVYVDAELPARMVGIFFCDF